MIERLKDRIQNIADELLNQVEDQPSMELIQDYAYPLPIIVISEMLGLPSEERISSVNGPMPSSQLSMYRRNISKSSRT